MDRRCFLLSSAAAGGVAGGRTVGPNDKIRAAVVGLRGRGRSHVRSYIKMEDVDLVALCDVDESVLETRMKDVEAAGRKRPTAYTDIRKLLEDKSIDVVSIATPNHWHTLMTVWACQAGKDVYVEKPCSHNVFEARQIVAATRKYDRIVQHGIQARSSVRMKAAVGMIREGVIGDVYMSRGLCYKWRGTIGRKPAEPVPPGVHYDLWLGPAPERPFSRNRFHYNWHWHWDYGNGDIGNQGIHEMDVARWGLGVKYPVKVSSFGGHFMFEDDQETPNTQTAAFEFNEGGAKKILLFEVRHWITNVEAGNGVSNLFYGSKGYFTRAGNKFFIGKEQAPGPEIMGEGEDPFVNFLKAVRSRRRSDLNAEIEEGAISCVLMHLANISYRLGRTLHFDPDTMTCTGDNEANRMLTRNYRAPFVVPEKV
jgi:predicted dehydrogenase